MDEAEETAMRRILVVDDDWHVGCAIGVSLKHHGFRVSIADSEPGGPDALDEGDLELMVVDLLMPRTTGFETIRLSHLRLATRLGAIDQRLRETEPDWRPLAALTTVAGAQRAAAVISNRMAVQALVGRRWNAPQPE